MARKTKKNLEGTEEILPEEDTTFLPETPEVPPSVEPVVTPEPPVTPAVAHKAPVASIPPVRKKRVRIRKKTTKHLSVAVLCTNPVTRRFI